MSGAASPGGGRGAERRRQRFRGVPSPRAAGVGGFCAATPGGGCPEAQGSGEGPGRVPGPLAGSAQGFPILPRPGRPPRPPGAPREVPAPSRCRDLLRSFGSPRMKGVPRRTDAEPTPGVAVHPGGGPALPPPLPGLPAQPPRPAGPGPSCAVRCARGSPWLRAASHSAGCAWTHSTAAVYSRRGARGHAFGVPDPHFSWWLRRVHQVCG